MKYKKFKDKYETKVLKKTVKNKKLVDYKWISKVTLLAFFISLAFSFFSETSIPNAGSILAVVVILLFIGIGILFDMVGVAITVADLKVFNSMASKQVRGAKIGVKLIKNSEKASSFCNDVIGDICGIVSGSASALLSSAIANSLNLNLFSVSLLVTAIVASLTIGGKAIGKSFAINKSSQILFYFSKFVSYFYKG